MGQYLLHSCRKWPGNSYRNRKRRESNRRRKRANGSSTRKSQYSHQLKCNLIFISKALPPIETYPHLYPNIARKLRPPVSPGFSSFPFVLSWFLVVSLRFVCCSGSLLHNYFIKAF